MVKSQKNTAEALTIWIPFHLTPIPDLTVHGLQEAGRQMRRQGTRQTVRAVGYVASVAAWERTRRWLLETGDRPRMRLQDELSRSESIPYQHYAASVAEVIDKALRAFAPDATSDERLTMGVTP